MMSRFVLEAVGTRGDLAPLLALGRELQMRGHVAHLLGPRPFADEARDSGLDYTPIVERAGLATTRFDDYYYPGFEASMARLSQIRDAEGSLLVVNIDKTSTSNLACEAFGLNAVRLHLAPFKIRSLVSPPWPEAARAQGPLGRAFLAHALPRHYERCDTNERLLAHVNQRRLSLGLAPTNTATPPEPYVLKQLGLFPEWYRAPASDWPEQLSLLGFPLPPAGDSLPPEVASFIRERGSPLVFTTGTGVTQVQGFLEQCVECCRLLSLPGVFLSQHLSEGRAAGGNVLVAKFVELKPLLRRSQLLVHHGGIGTAARALEAGLPQVVSPINYDQPDNAQHLMALGVARVAEREGLTGSRLARAVGSLLEDPEVEQRLATLAEKTRARDSLADCADRLEELARQRLGPRTRPGASSVASARTVVFLVWPEPGHVAVPFALARRLRQRGDRVVFASVSFIGPRILASGFDFVELAPAPRGGPLGLPSSILWQRSGDRSLAAEVDDLAARFRQMVKAHGPSLILVDSLYSILGMLAEASGTPWAQYETDLPRELDPRVPPPGCTLVPAASDERNAELRSRWASLLWSTHCRRSESLRSGPCSGWTMASAFPDRLVASLRWRTGARVSFDRATGMAPVARHSRLVFCPPELDFERSTEKDLIRCGHCIDLERDEPRFEWSRVPTTRKLIYCSLGTQSLRNPQAGRVLSRVLEAVSRREDWFVVIACHPTQAAALPSDVDSALVVHEAPQLGMLRRASAFVTHAGFNGLKEAVACGVPLVAVPLSHDQPRNAALVVHRGLGVALQASTLTATAVTTALDHVMGDASIRAACRRLQRTFREANGYDRALNAIDALMAEGPPRQRSSGAMAPHVARSTLPVGRRAAARALPRRASRRGLPAAPCRAPPGGSSAARPGAAGSESDRRTG